MNAKKRRVTQCDCVCGPESNAKKQYSLITEEMDNMSAFDLFVFRKWKQQSCGKTNEVKWNRVFHYSSMLSCMIKPPRWPFFHRGSTESR